MICGAHAYPFLQITVVPFSCPRGWQRLKLKELGDASVEKKQGSLAASASNEGSKECQADEGVAGRALRQRLFGQLD